MKKTRQKSIPPLLERYELKYMISKDMIKPIEEFALVYCSPDEYSLKSGNDFYRVNSLYLDTPDFLFLRMRQEHVQDRFNMRVRSYGDIPSLPYFLEIKQKTGGVVRKYRAKVNNKDWYRVYTEPGFLGAYANENSKESLNKKRFERMVYTYNASPVILTQYLRKALISDVDDYARITIDTDLRYGMETDYIPVPGKKDMTSCDHSMAFDPGCDVILELKCYTSSVPVWMIDLIRYFNLQRRSFSKYLTGMSELIKHNQYDSGTRISSAI